MGENIIFLGRWKQLFFVFFCLVEFILGHRVSWCPVYQDTVYNKNQAA